MMSSEEKCCYDSAYCDCVPGLNPPFQEFRFIRALRIPPHARTVQVRAYSIFFFTYFIVCEKISYKFLCNSLRLILARNVCFQV